jgi:hypothetical protein
MDAQSRTARGLGTRSGKSLEHRVFVTATASAQTARVVTASADYTAQVWDARSRDRPAAPTLRRSSAPSSTCSLAAADHGCYDARGCGLDHVEVEAGGAPPERERYLIPHVLCIAFHDDRLEAVVLVAVLPDVVERALDLNLPQR